MYLYFFNDMENCFGKFKKKNWVDIICKIYLKYVLD